MPKKDYTYTGYSEENKGRARALRKNMTRQERRLWYGFLHDYPVKVYRQRSIGKYIVDFYCPAANLVIELDGSQHYMPEGLAYDQARTQELEKYGLTVIRIQNSDVDRNLRGVCEYIMTEIEKRAVSNGR